MEKREMHDEAREPEMHGNEWTGETSEEAKKYLDEAGEAALERVAVLCGMTYGDVVRAYMSLNNERIEITLMRVDEPDEIQTVGRDSHEIPVKLHAVELIDQMHYVVLDRDVSRAFKSIKTRDGGQRKGWQTCYGPAQRRSSTKSKDWRTWTAGRKR